MEKVRFAFYQSKHWNGKRIILSGSQSSVTVNDILAVCYKNKLNVPVLIFLRSHTWFYVRYILYNELSYSIEVNHKAAARISLKNSQILSKFQLSIWNACISSKQLFCHKTDQKSFRHPDTTKNTFEIIITHFCVFFYEDSFTFRTVPKEKISSWKKLQPKSKN